MAKVLITGGTGLVGSRLSDLLRQQGYEIHVLSRSKTGLSDGVRYFKWSTADRFIEDGALEVDHIVHLAGAGVADKRWTKQRKKELLESRTVPTELLQEALEGMSVKPKSVVCASAVGYYGNRGDEVLSEDSEPGEGFLTEICEKWERATTDLGKAAGSPTAILRIGIVLSLHGGALPEISKPIKFGIGAYLGDGKQYYPWIHIDDLCGIITHCMENKLDGVFNASAPVPATNKALSKTIAYVLDKPFIPAPAPAFILKLAMGEMAQMLLNSQRTSASKIMDKGFEFNHPDLKKALKDIFRRKV